MALLDKIKRDQRNKSWTRTQMSVYVRWPGDRRYQQGTATYVSAHGAFITVEALPDSIPRAVELVFALQDDQVTKLRRMSALVAGVSARGNPTVFCSFGETWRHERNS